MPGIHVFNYNYKVAILLLLQEMKIPFDSSQCWFSVEKLSNGCRLSCLLIG